MKRVIALLLCLVLAVSVLAACGEPEEVHTHTYSESWTSDAEGHWYEPTCTCEDAIIRKLSHTDANNDGACDVCTFTNHTHTYSEDWTVDCTNHWHAADCGHIVAGADVAAHADENEDGKCDVCNYVIKDIHDHYYSTEWSYDETNHWHAALCEHGAELADVAAHNIDAAGYCTVCDNKVAEIDMTDIGAVLAAAAARNHKVIDGNVIASQLIYGGTESAPTLETAQTNEVFFVLGNGYSYIFYKTFDMYGDYVGGDHQYYEQISDDEVFGVQMEAGSYELSVISGDAQFLNGYTYFPGSILPSDSDDTSTLANTLCALYAIVENGTNVSNVTESYDEETGTYSFSFRYFIVNSTAMSDGTTQYQVELYGTAVDFTVDDNGVINLAEFAVSCYRNWEMDHDIDYDPETNTVTMRDSANPSIYAFSVSQRSGERTYTTPYPKSSLIPTDFELSYVTGTDTEDGSGLTIITSEEPIVDTDDDGVIDIELSTGEYVRLHLSSLVPVTAIASALDIDDFSMTFVNNDETASGVLWQDQDFLRPSYSGYMDCITFKVAEAGDYTVTISFGDLTKVINITVIEDQTPDVGDDDENTINVETTDTYGFFDLYSYTATAAGTYTFNLPAGLGFWEKYSMENGGFTAMPDVDFYDNENGATVDYYLGAGETLEFYVGAFTKDAWVITVDYAEGGDPGNTPGGGNDGGDEGGESGTIGDISGTYYSGDNVLVINADGTMTFTYGSSTLNYTYRVDGNTIYYSLNGNSEYTSDDGMAPFFGYLTFGADGMPATFEYNSTSYALSTTAGGGVDGDDPVVVPETSGVIYANTENPVTVTEDHIAAGKLYVSFMPWESGEYSIWSGNLGVSSVMTAEGTVIEANDYGNYVLESWTSYIVELNTQWLFGGAGDYTVNADYNYPEGHQENPFYYFVGEDATATFPGGYSPVWYQFYANATGTLTLTSDYAGVTLILTARPGDDITNENGESSITLDVIQGRLYYIGIAAFEATEPVDITFNASITEGEITTDGTINVPHQIVMGDNVAVVPSWSNVWFMYTAEADGTVTFTTNSDNYAWYAVTDLSAPAYGTTGDISVHLYYGETVYLYVETADLAAGEIPFAAAWVDDPTTVYYENNVATDGTANAIVIDEKTCVSLSFWGNGKFTVTWDNSDAVVELVSFYGPGTALTNGEVISAGMMGTNLNVYISGYAAGTVNLTITPCVDPGLVLVMGENTVSVTDTWYGTTATFTATAAGTYYVIPGTNAVIFYDDTNYFNGDVIELTLDAGDIVSLIVFTEDYSEGNVVLTISDTAPSQGGDTDSM